MIENTRSLIIVKYYNVLKIQTKIYYKFCKQKAIAKPSWLIESSEQIIRKTAKKLVIL